MISIFPFLINYSKVSNYMNDITQVQLPDSTIAICYIMINFINIWFIITILKLILTTFKKIINTLF